ncbi:MAG TPA: glutamate--tRNA ligase family protein [Gemmatimonadales bacterium]|jgi:glutamyl-tRNA synthetase/glutamyl-Q tRNA(Asp) synthetase
MGDAFTTRFAPAPTGYLHLGHVANAIYVWGMARAHGGKVLLRVEDHDRQRCRPEYQTALLEDLEWLGFTPDRPSFAELKQGPSSFRQSDNHAAYESALEVLRARHRVYACECSRKDEAVRAKTGDKADETARSEEGETAGEVPYSGRCRERGLAPGPGRGLRVVLEPGQETFTDLLLGEQRQDPSRQCGDLLLRDRLGNWTYQFAVVVDDLRHGVTAVIRGEDLLASTGRQMRLARMLGADHSPDFAHHPLILKPSGDKLSKANRDTAVRELRASGLSAQEVIGRAAAAVGLIPELRPVEAEEMILPFRLRPGRRHQQ